MADLWSASVKQRHFRFSSIREPESTILHLACSIWCWCHCFSLQISHVKCTPIQTCRPRQTQSESLKAQRWRGSVNANVGSALTVLTEISRLGWICMKLNVPLMMNCNQFGYPQTFPLQFVHFICKTNVFPISLGTILRLVLIRKC